ncbi:SDR family oxidoreductase [Streptomonospora sp. PA3]|uniref:SDR family oxidoreductase n=1 Tax=Streptomonospora sp. PA3 TaxID=2607326 RepID=UPI00130A7E4C|nr:SDR family oxidoreductase [Streptomonospora sp. PA3]
MRVKDRVVVITGASSGIGRATALALAGKGASVVLAARREEALEEVARQCRSRGGQALAVPTDVTDPEAVEALARRAADRFDGIDVWVNAAAVTMFGRFSEVPLKDFRRVVDTNLMGYVHGARAALPYLRDRRKGVLVNVSSLLGVIAQPYTHAYCATKSGIRGLSSSLRQELRLEGASNVHVCSVLPPTIDTPIFEQAANYTGRRVHAMPPIYTPEHVAHIIVGLVRVPRREAAVGPGRGLIALHKAAPGLSERLMQTLTDRLHLSHGESAAAGSGNLYRSTPGTGSVHGGWHGRRRTAARRLAAAAVVGGIAAAGVRRIRR